MKTLTKLVCLILIWLLMMMFSHDYLAHNLNHQNQSISHKIETGSHDFKLDALQLDEVVKSFQSHWESRPDGLVALTSRPELSVELNGFIVTPKIHQFIRINSNVDGSDAQGFFKLEFSNQQDQLYYDSADINLNQLANKIDLNGINWTQNDLIHASRTPVEWSKIGQLDAWVIRFYPVNNLTFFVSSLAIEQDAVNKLTSANQQLCSNLGLNTLDCWVNNKMRYLNQSAIYQSGASTIVYPTFYMTSPWILLVLAWLLTVLLVYLFFVPSAVVYALITVVYVAIGLLHQNWMIDFATVFRWPLLLMCILLLWLHKKLFFNFINLALPVWFISGGLAVGIMALGHFEFEFVRSLPLYFLWAGVQQVLIGPVFSAQIQHHFKTPQLMTACLVGVLFSIIHTPNHLLMVVTLISGIAWSYAWLKYENIYANAFSHALLALVFYQSIPNKWFGSARIGVFF